MHRFNFVKNYLCILWLLPVLCFSQPLSIKKCKGAIIIDGVINEADWMEADTATDFRQHFPMDTSLATAPTVVRMAYDEHFIYVVAVMHNKGPRTYVTPSLRRDFRGGANDGFSIIFDTFMDRTNAFMFGINPFGVQREGLISNGGGQSEDDFSLTWDNKWYGASKIYDTHWVAEIAIPFKTLRFKEQLDKWLINFYRIDSYYAEASTWARIPRNFDIINLAFCRQLQWDQPLKKPGPNISLIPYVSTQSSKNFEEGTNANKKIEIGGDAKIGIGPALNLDLTINPDFSQVEVDEQVTNLDRFEIFFPEQRQFFLENADLFSAFGMPSSRPFFSRRIGVARDTSTGQNVQNPITYGARLSGKITKNTRIGLLNMHTGELPTIGVPGTNYTVVTTQQKLFGRSNISFIGINKQTFQDSLGGEFTWQPEKYNRLLGADFNLATMDNKWTGKAFYHQSFDQQNLDSTFSAGLLLNFSTYRWYVSSVARTIGGNYNPEVGYVRRKDIQQVASTVFYYFYPRTGNIQSHGPGFDFDIVRNQTHGLLDWDYNFLYLIRWKTTAEFFLRARRQFTFLFNPFDPSGSKGQELDAGTSYTTSVLWVDYFSDARKRFSWQFSVGGGEYFNGSLFNAEGSIAYRYQPFGFISLNYAYNRIRLPYPYKDADLVLLGPRIDLTFTRNIFWTTFIQYNSQINNLNINSRLQWRFKPVSDIFLVYTDNYFASTLQEGTPFHLGDPKARAIVFKMTYWLNI